VNFDDVLALLGRDVSTLELACSDDLNRLRPSGLGNWMEVDGAKNRESSEQRLAVLGVSERDEKKKRKRKRRRRRRIGEMTTPPTPSACVPRKARFTAAPPSRDAKKVWPQPLPV
jgi:hypothetical protein